MYGMLIKCYQLPPYEYFVKRSKFLFNRFYRQATKKGFLNKRLLLVDSLSVLTDTKIETAPLICDREGGGKCVFERHIEEKKT